MSPAASKFDYASETWSALSDEPIDQQYAIPYCPTHNAMAGYLGGGIEFNGATAAETDQIQKFLMASDAFAMLSATLSTVRRVGGGLNKRDEKGYWIAGLNALGQLVATADKITFSTETVAAESGANASSARTSIASVNGDAAGYLCGGPNSSVVDKTTFATDSTAVNSSSLPAARQNACGSSNGSFGYVCGGMPNSFGSTQTTTYKLDLATDSFSTPAGAALTESRHSHCGASNLTYSYFAGGRILSFGSNGAKRTSTERIEYTTDTSLLLASGTTDGCLAHGYGSEIGL